MKKLKVPTVENHPTGWSYSAWGMFKKCMYFYYCVRILRMSEGTNIHMERGIKEHKIQEQYLKGNISVLPKNYADLKQQYKALKNANPIVEQFWGVDNRWKPSKWKSWAVMKMDAAVAPCRQTDYNLFIQDLKTGKEYENHMDQGLVYGAIGLAIYPKAENVEAEFWYVDQGYVVHHDIPRDVIMRERKKWEERGKEMLSPRKKWPKSPSQEGCKWCFLRSDRGGPCHGWKELP